MSALPPATLEGWYALHQAFSTDWSALRGRGEEAAQELQSLCTRWAAPEQGGWSAAFRVVGGGADWLWVHFRPTLDALAEAETELRRTLAGRALRLEYDYLSVTEAGLYHATAETAAAHAPGSEAFREEIERRGAEEAASAHVRARLYPRVPEGMRYLSFYPMSKRRLHPDNWYTLPVDERSRLMRDHGLTGRRFAGRIFQVITGSIGLDDWEWGVTLFARDPLDFKRIVTEMRFDEASARFGEFGRFFTGIRIEPAEWMSLLAGGVWQGPAEGDMLPR
ncbi:MAG: heme-dependent peroxidase [Gemmatimonadota bacterium]|jgi:chlorite dismutase|nr:heme-dependent peroxidase [Gemmatimonadota bacterium]